MADNFLHYSHSYGAFAAIDGKFHMSIPVILIVMKFIWKGI